jgi:hypothetical protein
MSTQKGSKVLKKGKPEMNGKNDQNDSVKRKSTQNLSDKRTGSAL